MCSTSGVSNRPTSDRADRRAASSWPVAIGAPATRMSLAPPAETSVASSHAPRSRAMSETFPTSVCNAEAAEAGSARIMSSTPSTLTNPTATRRCSGDSSPLSRRWRTAGATIGARSPSVASSLVLVGGGGGGRRASRARPSPLRARVDAGRAAAVRSLTSVDPVVADRSRAMSVDTTSPPTISSRCSSPAMKQWTVPEATADVMPSRTRPTLVVGPERPRRVDRISQAAQAPARSWSGRSKRSRSASPPNLRRLPPAR
jgi:hypothetical protein